MKTLSDEELMQAYGKGEFAAFEKLYARYREPLYRYIVHLLKDEATANDLFQVTWEKVIKAAPDYRRNTPFRAWIYVIARNSVMDHFRQNKRRREDEMPMHVAADAPGPEDRARDEQKSEDLLTAIGQLPPDQRDTLMLRLAAGLKLDAIAEVTGVSTEAAKSRLRYAISKLRTALGDTDEH